MPYGIHRNASITTLFSCKTVKGAHRNSSPPKYIIPTCAQNTAAITVIKAGFCKSPARILALPLLATNAPNTPQKTNKAKKPDKNALLPLPQTEIDKSKGVLVQNPDYQ